MHRKNLAAGLMLGLSLSTFLVACDRGGDTPDLAALERESLERELELALQPDSMAFNELNDIPFESVVEPASPPAAPAPTPRPASRPAATPPPAPRPTSPAPAPAPAPAAPRVRSYSVPAGTTFGVRLDEQVSTRSHSVGSGFSGTLTEAIYAPDGTTLIPAGATVRGRVIDSRESGRAGQDATLSIEFTSISHGGSTYPISGSVLDTPVRLVNRDSRTEQVAKVGGGAAVGAVLGQILGRNTKSTVAGAAIGAAAGTAVAMGTAEVDAVVDQGAQMRIRLDRGITVEREG